MRIFNTINLKTLNKNNKNRAKIYFNKNKLNNSLLDYLIYFVFLISTTFCLFYG